MNDSNQIDFEQAIGEEFAVSVSPLIPFEDASPHDCREVIWSVFGAEVSADVLSQIDAHQMETLAYQFGRYFEAEAPSTEQIVSAIRRTPGRWPANGGKEHS